MAHVRYPKYSKVVPGLAGCPYILTDAGEYPEPINFFLQDRWEGLVSFDGRDDLDDAWRIGKHAVAKLADHLANFISWTEFPQAHPWVPKLHWKDVQPHHIRYLYKEHMVAGYWSQEFFASGIVTSLSPASTIKPRVRDNMACWRFMARNKFIAHWDETEVEGRASAELRKSVAALDQLKSTEQTVRKYTTRQNPRTIVLPPIDDLRAVCGELSATPQCLFRLILSRGYRLQEAIENTLLPGELCQRTEYFLKVSKPHFPSRPYILQYDPSDDSMIGVLPPPDSVFGANEPMGKPHVILGKGSKIRRIELLPSLIRNIWRYAATERLERARKSGRSYPNLLLDRLGRPYSVTAFSRALLVACRRASRKAGRKIKVTAHILRHAFACFFLEACIIGKAKDEGLDPHLLTLSQINEFAEGPILIIKEDLGHVFIETTMRYLHLLKTGKLGFQYHRLWNEFLDKEGV